MKWLVDAQLPPNFCLWFLRHQEESIHVIDFEGGLTYPDDRIWEFAKNNQYIIVTKDRDFVERSFVFGAPPQVVHLDIGNCSNQELFLIFSIHWEELVKFIKSNKSLIVMTQTSIYTF